MYKIYLIQQSGKQQVSCLSEQDCNAIKRFIEKGILSFESIEEINNEKLENIKIIINKKNDEND
jgi:hypothetical protein